MTVPQLKHSADTRNTAQDLSPIHLIQKNIEISTLNFSNEYPLNTFSLTRLKENQKTSHKFKFWFTTTIAITLSLWNCSQQQLSTIAKRI